MLKYIIILSLVSFYCHADCGFNITARTCMTQEEAFITNNRFQNKESIFGRPKGLLYGNIVGSGPEQKGNLYPDQSATYFVANICLPSQSSLILTGEFPHARYMSITVARQVGSSIQNKPHFGNGDNLRDANIVPDDGSLNPFIAGVGRNVINRNYTVVLQSGDPPDNIPNNTLYSRTSDETSRVHLSLRIYLVDKGYDGSGSHRGIPEVTLVWKGQRFRGAKLLSILKAKKIGDPDGYSKDHWLWKVRRSEDPTNAPCPRNPFSQVFWNTDYSVTGAFDIDNPEERVRKHPPSSDGGFANNPDTKYMLIMGSFGFGSALVIRGKKPLHPCTRHGQDDLSNNTQIQLFSISVSASPNSGESWRTIVDEQIPTDEKGYYTVVVSWPWNRPSNATVDNGIIGLDPGVGEGHYVHARMWVFTVIVRYQNPNPNWKESPSNIPMPTLMNPIPMDEKVMKEYYPRTHYLP